MDYEIFDKAISARAQFVVEQLSGIRTAEIVIIAMLAVSIGIGIAILIQLKKLKDRL